jgi:antitoxin PrlF
MNAQAKIEGGIVAHGGNVRIPEEMLRAAGLVPGQPYKVMMNEAGQVVVAPLGLGPEDADERVRLVTQAIMSIAGKYATGQSTDDYMREIRGDFEP